MSSFNYPLKARVFGMALVMLIILLTFIIIPRVVDHGGDDADKNKQTSTSTSTSILTPEASVPVRATAGQFPAPPLQYVAIKLHQSEKIKVDGKIQETAWDEAPWSETFGDIEGDINKHPPFGKRTNIKMRWDDTYLYVAAVLEASQIWANMTQSHSVISNDNDFEVFIDPDGSTHWYKKLEVNALGKIRDLIMDKPYIDGGVANAAWDMSSLKAATYVNGSINDPSVTSNFWTLELAIPFQDVIENSTISHAPPRDWDQWRINFARVEWQVETLWNERMNQSYFNKLPNQKQEVWVWSPQYANNMHLPERWGFVQFSLNRCEFLLHRFEFNMRTILAQVYYAQKKSMAVNGYFVDDLTKLELPSYVFSGAFSLNRPEIVLNGSDFFTASVSSPNFDGVGHINQERFIWFTQE